MPKNDVASEKSSIEKLSTFAHQKIGTYLEPQDLKKLIQTSSMMFSHSHESLEKKAAETLSSHVLRGEKAEALKMIAAKPKLLLRPSEASDYSGHPYKRFTPFQLALLCHDFTLWKKMEPYFDKLPNGQAEKQKQFKAIFPAGIPQQEPYDFNPLIEAISTSPPDEIEAALQKESNGTTICKALEAFIKNFTDLAKKEKKEMFFNPLHLITALDICDRRFGTWSRSQRDLFWHQVIGCIQSFLPACYLETFRRGRLLMSLKFQYHADGEGLAERLAAHARPQARRQPWRSFAEQIRQSSVDLNIACGMTDNPSRAATI